MISQIMTINLILPLKVIIMLFFIAVFMVDRAQNTKLLIILIFMEVLRLT